MSGAVAERANATSKRLGGTPAFLYATVATFVGWHNVEFHVRADDVERTLVANNVVCANCRFFGGGMKIAPDALARRRAAGRDPGRRHLEGRLRPEPAPALPGHARRHRKVEHLRARRIEITPVRTLPAEIDGEQPGTTPVTFEASPGVLDLIVP